MDISNLIIGIIAVLINLFIGFYLSKKIEKAKLKNSQELSSFTSNLSLINKKSEIKFHKYQIEQADAIKQLYSILIELKHSTISIFDKDSKIVPHHDFKNCLDNWVNNYSIFYNYFNKNKILLSEKLIELMRVDFNNLNKIYSLIFKKKKNLEELEMFCYGNTDNLYSNVYDEESNIRIEITKLKEEMESEARDFKFACLLNELEKEYRKLLCDD